MNDVLMYWFVSVCKYRIRARFRRALQLSKVWIAGHFLAAKCQVYNILVSVPTEAKDLAINQLLVSTTVILSFDRAISAENLCLPGYVRMYPMNIY